MAKSARASGIKKNKAVLKRRVFGPAETARNERMNAKLLALAKTPKPPREEMEVVEEDEDSAASKEEATKENSAAEEADADMEIDSAATTKTQTKAPKSKREVQRLRSERVSTRGRQKPRNQVAFPSHPRKGKGGKSGPGKVSSGKR